MSARACAATTLTCTQSCPVGCFLVDFLGVVDHSDKLPQSPPAGLRGVVARRGARPPRRGSTAWLTAVTAVLCLTPLVAHWL